MLPNNNVSAPDPVKPDTVTEGKAGNQGLKKAIAAILTALLICFLRMVITNKAITISESIPIIKLLRLI